MDETAPPLPPGGHLERLLLTSDQDVPADYVDALTQFCAEAPGVERGYICAVRIEREGIDPEQRLKFCVKLDTPISEPQDSREASVALLTRLSQSQARLVHELGFGVIADRAVPAWEAKALRIYPR